MVNAGVIDHPVTGQPVAAFVGRPATHKIAHLRENPRATPAVARRVGVGRPPRAPSSSSAPTTRSRGSPATTSRASSATVYSAAGGGEHDDWAEYDRVMAAERRMAVLLTPTRIYVNP